MSKSLSNDSRWASVRKRPRSNGSTAYAVLYRIDGRQSAITFDDARQADALVALIKAHGAERALSMHNIDAAPRRQHGAVLTVGGWIDQHIEALSGVERKTVAEYKRYLVRDIEPTLGSIPLSALSRMDLSRWVNKLREDGASGKTCSNKLGFLSGCLNAAVREGHIPANPATGVRLPRTVRREMCFLTPTEFDLLKAAFTERWHPLLDLLVTSGCRFSEATALTPADVDRDNTSIRIRQAWKRVPDGSGERYELGQPKTRRSVRTVSVPAPVIEGLDLTRDWVFTNSQGGPIRLYSWRSNVWVPSVAKAKATDPNKPDKPVLTKPIRIHDLRHTCASWLLGAGVPLIVVSQHLGHEDVSVTAKVYGHLDRTAGNAAADAMAKMLGSHG
ncbi:tyrosine-type recombinase/integrase [Mycobacterium sp. M23085]|uniref:tyrosine-type recombinase/integrase n=1 Tax=Mycobacterium sp. M23085 TaxID=3378087 RepID=UPI0038778F76